MGRYTDSRFGSRDSQNESRGANRAVWSCLVVCVWEFVSCKFGCTSEKVPPHIGSSRVTFCLSVAILAQCVCCLCNVAFATMGRSAKVKPPKVKPPSVRKNKIDVAALAAVIREHPC